MTERAFFELGCSLSALSVFRGVLQQPAMAALLRCMTGCETTGRIADYGAFVYALKEDGYSLPDFLRRVLFADENAYVTAVARGAPVPDALRDNAQAELKLFSALTRLDAAAFRDFLDHAGYLPRFETAPADFAAAYSERLAQIGRCGYGIFSTARMFRVDGQNEIVPIKTADRISQDSFVGYEEQRRQVFGNTRALLDGRPAANILLFGDAGTGKSSTVKACVNRFADEGVRLIELRKDQLFALPHVMGAIQGNPLKFIVFIDDLSFTGNDDSFSMLKAALEGSAAAKAENAVIYATSNRRHIVKETFSDRSASDDVHRGDTMQELMSLSDRFGLTVYYPKPDKRLYLEIVRALAARAGVMMEQSELDRRAESFALAKGGRSPRAAEQFVQSLQV